MALSRESFIRREASFLKRKARGWQRKTRAFKQMLGRFTPYLRKRKGPLFMALACALGYILLSLLEPWPIKLILDNVLLDRSLPALFAPILEGLQGSPMRLLYVIVGSVIVIAILRGILYYYRELMMSLVGQQTVADIRQDLYSHLNYLSFSYHDHRRTGDLLSRLTNDIRVLRNSLISLPVSLAGDIFLTLGMTIVMFIMDWQLTLIALTVFPGLALAVRLYQGPLKRAIREQREREGNLSNMAAENLGAYKVVQGFTLEQQEIKNSVRRIVVAYVPASRRPAWKRSSTFPQSY